MYKQNVKKRFIYIQVFHRISQISLLIRTLSKPKRNSANAQLLHKTSQFDIFWHKPKNSEQKKSIWNSIDYRLPPQLTIINQTANDFWTRRNFNFDIWPTHTSAIFREFSCAEFPAEQKLCPFWLMTLSARLPSFWLRRTRPKAALLFPRGKFCCFSLRFYYHFIYFEWALFAKKIESVLWSVDPADTIRSILLWEHSKFTVLKFSTHSAYRVLLHYGNKTDIAYFHYVMVRLDIMYIPLYNFMVARIRDFAIGRILYLWVFFFFVMAKYRNILSFRERKLQYNIIRGEDLCDSKLRCNIYMIYNVTRFLAHLIREWHKSLGRLRQRSKTFVTSYDCIEKMPHYNISSVCEVEIV